MREIFTINYVVGDEVKTFALGQDVFYVSTTYPTISCRCKECGSIYDEKKETQRKIIPCTITGFKIAANYSFSYNTQNSFVLTINVIHNESDKELYLPWFNCFTTIEEAKEELKRLSVWNGGENINERSRN